MRRCYKFGWKFGLVLLAGELGACGGGAPAGTTAVAVKPAGMRAHDYLACDGGPHLVLPVELSTAWTGVDRTGLGGDYARACAATVAAPMAFLSVGSGRAMVFQEPALSAWGRSPEGWIDVYLMHAVKTMDLDGLIARAVAVVGTGAMKDTGEKMVIGKPDLYLLSAGDTPTSSAYGVSRITMAAGQHSVLRGEFTAPGEEVEIYRFRPEP